jgi:nitroreductase
MVLEAIQLRKSEFAFSSKAVEDEKIDTLFEAAGLAPSSMNVQPWRFIFGKREEPEFQEILSLLFEGNQKWAKDAALLILSIGQTEYTFNGKVYKNDYASHDTGMATALLMIQATELGLASHPMGGFDHNKAIENFSLPKEYQPLAIIAIGYKGDESKLSEDLFKRQSAPRKRKALNEIAFRGKFEK